MQTALQDFKASTQAVRLVLIALDAEVTALMTSAPAPAAPPVILAAAPPIPVVGAVPLVPLAPALAVVVAPAPAAPLIPAIPVVVHPPALAIIGARHAVICAAMTVVLSGYFEAFIRDCAKGFIKKLGVKPLSFAALPVGIQNCHFREGAKVLSDAARNKPWIKTTAQDIAERLADAVRVTPSKPLWEAFADTNSNPNADVVLSFLRNFGVTEPSVKIELKAGRPPGYWQNLKSRIDNFIEVRNECAHTGSTVTAPQTTTISSYCDLLDHSADMMVQILEDHLLTF